MADTKPQQATIFYAWQSDTPSGTNRSFIEKAIGAAVKRLRADATLEFAERELEVTIERDTRGVPGSPPIAATILDKIDKCAVFVADLTFVGESLTGLTVGRRLFSNPNVLLEYGYSLKTHGHSRIIAVLNTAFGPAPHFDQLPFDLRHLRRPIEYRLGPDDAAAQKKAAFDALVAEFVSALRLILRPATAAAPRRPRALFATEFFQPATIANAANFFRHAGDLIPEPPFDEGPLAVEIPEAPTACVRLYPRAGVPPLKSEMAAKNLASQGDLRPMGVELGGRDWSRNAMGAIAYAGPVDAVLPGGAKRPGTLRNFTQLFTSGEICGVDFGVVHRIRGHGEKGEFAFRLLMIHEFELSCALALQDFLRFSRVSLKHSPPLHVEASVRGIKGCLLGLGDARKGNALREDVVWLHDAQTHAVEAAKFMRPFFEEVWEAFGVQRPEAAQVRLTRNLGQK